MALLKQSTAVTVPIGPFVDKTDFVTPETGLGGNGGNIETNVRLSKAGAAFVTRNSTTDPVHDIAGWYSLHLDATDTSTAGSLIIECSDASTYAPVRKEFTVLPARAFALQVDGATFNANGGRVWYVAGQAAGTMILSNPTASIRLRAKSTGTAAGSEGNGTKTLTVVNGTSQGTAYDTTTNVLTATVNISGGNNTVTHLAGVINSGSHFFATVESGGGLTISTSTTGSGTLSGGTDGSSSNPGTLSSPFNSFASAQSAASRGDTIILIDGNYDAFTVSKDALTVEGQSRAGVVVYGTGGAVIVKANSVTVRRFTTTLVGVDEGVGVTVDFDVINAWVDDANINGNKDGFYARSTFGTRVTSSHIHATWDPVMLSNAKNFVVENCLITGDGLNTTANAAIAAIHCAEGAVGIVRNTDVVITSSNTISGLPVAGVSVGQASGGPSPAVLLENVHISIAQTDDEATGGAYGIVGDYTNYPTQSKCLVMFLSGSIEVSHANIGAQAKEIDASVSGSKVFVYGVDFTLANCLGTSNIYPLDLNVLDIETRALLALPAVAPGTSGGLTLVP